MMHAIFIFDFDLTITAQHTHNLLIKMINTRALDPNDHEKAWQFAKQIKPTATPQEWRELFMQLIDAGHQVAIASFNSFDDIIKRYLEEIIQLPKSYLNKIFIEAWLPDQPTFADKNKHVQNVLHHFGYNGPAEFIFLIDDSEYNCLAARQHGWQIIIADSTEINPKYITRIKGLVEELKKL